MQKYQLDVAKVGWQDPLQDGEAGLALSLQTLNALPCSNFLVKKETTSPSFTLKGQWWYPLTKQEIEISTDQAAVVVFATTFNQRLSKCLPGFLLFHSQLLIIKSSQWKSITFRLPLFVCS